MLVVRHQPSACQSTTEMLQASSNAEMLFEQQHRKQILLQDSSKEKIFGSGDAWSDTMIT